MGDEGPVESGPEVTSDYEPSQEGSMFGSLSSSVREHVWEYGRRYHLFKYGRYPLPNDDDEFKRESLRHIMLKELMRGELYLAPIEDNPQRIIDLGTGFGEWAIEVGETFPGATVIGVDLSPIQPGWIPPNVDFIVDDIEDEWVYAHDFDFVHLRFTAVSIRDKAKLERNILQYLRPGGWVEYLDYVPRPISDDGDALPPDCPLQRFYSLSTEVFRKVYGFDGDYICHLHESLEQQGFVNVQRKAFRVPIGDWPRCPRMRTIGGYFREILMSSVTAMAARPFVEFGMEKTEIEELANSVGDCLREGEVHAYIVIQFVWAQKPDA